MSESYVSSSAGATALLSGALAELAGTVQRGVVRVRAGRGFGAGTIWRADGIVVTNHHVVPGEGAEIALADGRHYSARVVARDSGNDLAMLRVEATDLPALPLRDARTLRAGELVVAVGHPVGMVGAASLGVVTAALPARSVEDERELIRADVLLRPGNSGGPLVDAAGRVVGINAMVAGGLALSVPSHVVEQLLARRERPRLGVGVQAVRLTPAQAVAAGTDVALLVASLAPASAVERAGVLVGDVLLAFDGQPLASSEALLAALAEVSSATASLRLLRGGSVVERVVSFGDTSARQAA